MDEKNNTQSEFVKSLLELFPIVENSEGRIDTANDNVQWILETIKIEDEELKLVDQHRLWARLDNGSFVLLDAPQDFLNKLKYKTQ